MQIHTRESDQPHNSFAAAKKEPENMNKNNYFFSKLRNKILKFKFYFMLKKKANIMQQKNILNNLIMISIPSCVEFRNCHH